MKKKDKKRNLASLWMAALFFLFSANQLAYAEYQIGGKSLSTDEMLEYTLADLKQRMQKAADVNDKLLEKNNAIRKRITFLKQQLKEFEEYKSTLAENSRDLADKIHPAPEAYFGAEAHMQDFDARQARIQKDRGEIQDQIQKGQEKQERLKKDVVDLKDKITRFQQRAREVKSASIKQEQNKEKDSLLGIFNKRRLNARKKKDEIALLKKKLSVPAKKRKDLSGRQDFLEQELIQAQKDLKVAHNEKRRIGEASLDFSSRKREETKRAKEEVAQLKLYRDRMEDALEKFQNAQKVIISQEKPHNQNMEKFKGFLERERQLLLRNIEAARRSVKLSEDLREQTREKVSLRRRQERDLGAQQSQVEGEQQRIQRQIEDNQKERDLLEKEIKGLNNGVEELRKELKNKDIAPIQQKHKEKESHLMRLLKERSVKLKRTQQTADILEKNLAGLRAKKEEHLKRQDSLEQELWQSERDLQAGVYKGQELNALAFGFRNQNEKREQKTREKIIQLKLYRENLGDALKKFQDVYQSMASQFGPHDQRMNEARRFLEQENQLLSKNVKAAQRSFESIKELKEAIETKVPLMDSKAKAEEQNRILDGAQDDILAQISSQQKKEQAAGDKIEDVTKEIKQLKKQMKIVLSQETAAKRTAERSGQDRLSKRLQEYTQKNREAQGKLISLKGDVGRSNEKLGQSRGKQDYLNKLLMESKGHLRRVRTPKASSPELYNLSARGGPGKNTQKVNEEIDALKTRQMVLSTSLSTIRSKYNITALETGMSNKEEKELNEYLALLRQENEGLRNRISTITASLNKLEIEKAGLGKRGALDNQ